MTGTASALLIVLAAIVLARHLAMRTGLVGRAAGAAGLRVSESCALTNRTRLCIVEVEGRRLLVAVSDGSCELLDRLPPVPSPSEASEPAAESRPARSGRWRVLQRVAPLAILACVLVPDLAYAQAAAADPATISIGLGGVSEPDEISGALEIVALLTLVSVAPSILLMMTCFTRVIIVLAFLRQAIGIQQLPPSQVLAGLALFITFFVMAPVGERIHADAYAPYVAKEIDAAVAAERAATPVREFLLTHTREADLSLFLELAGKAPVAALEEVPLTSLLPAFMLSELRTAFEIGFMIYLPFLVIDLIIASMLISMGMIVLPPIVISLPFKLMLFVLMDGWNRVVGALVGGLV